MIRIDVVLKVTALLLVTLAIGTFVNNYHKPVPVETVDISDPTTPCQKKLDELQRVVAIANGTGRVPGDPVDHNVKYSVNPHYCDQK